MWRHRIAGCGTCVDALNRLWTKILCVVNAATCAQVHVQIVFRSLMVQRGAEFSCTLRSMICSMHHGMGAKAEAREGNREGRFLAPCTRARGLPGRYFLRGRVSCAFAGRQSPCSLSLQAALRSWSMLKSVSSVRWQIWRHAGHDGEVFMWPSSRHREINNKKKSFPGFGWATFCCRSCRTTWRFVILPSWVSSWCGWQSSRRGFRYFQLASHHPRLPSIQLVLEEELVSVSTAVCTSGLLRVRH